MLMWLRGKKGSGEGEVGGNVSAEALKAALDAGEKPLLLDVRQACEFATGALPGAVSIPLTQLGARQGELNRNGDIVVYCHSGGRSAVACAQLRRLGFTRVRNLSGGIMAWSRLG